MRIVKISVRGLFNRFDHELVFRADEPITIMIGPNGFGKTMMLRLINGLFNQPIRTLARMPFRELEVVFDNVTSLTITRLHEQGRTSKKRKHREPDLQLTFAESGKAPEVFHPAPRINLNELPFPVGAIESVIPDLDQMAPAQWRHIPTGAILDLDAVFDRYGQQLASFGQLPATPQPEWLAKIRQAIPVRLIDTERLNYQVEYNRSVQHGRWQAGPPQFERTVGKYSRQLGETIKQTLTEYGTLSQQLDRTFPSRLVRERVPALSSDELSSQLAKVEHRRLELTEAGLLPKTQEGWDVPHLEQVDDSQKKVLAVYVKDATQKLSVFDRVFSRIDTFKRITNAHFSYKAVTITSDGFKVVASDGSPLDLEMLSSGEQHELVLLYDLLFRVLDNSLILIDEPELSLHVAWQAEFLSDIREMAKLSDFRALLATHSPDIIGDQMDQAIELKGPKD